jgi:hypothetical protein
MNLFDSKMAASSVWTRAGSLTRGVLSADIRQRGTLSHKRSTPHPSLLMLIIQLLPYLSSPMMEV